MRLLNDEEINKTIKELHNTYSGKTFSDIEYENLLNEAIAKAQFNQDIKDFLDWIQISGSVANDYTVWLIPEDAIQSLKELIKE
jgi:predicted phosphatase